VARDASQARQPARRRSPARLVIALSVAAVLTVFLLYSSIAGGGTPSLRPSTLAGHTGNVSLTGYVLKPVTGDAHGSGLHFRLRDVKGTATVPVVYTGSVPDLFRPGRDIVVEGQFKNGVFVASPGTMVTKCPSKYTPKKS
jgi:cytochrome c-type biogenesis protein CcmE